MAEELVSIIIPVYRVEKYLRRCLDSVRQQTYSNIEVLLVDDGSPDRCPAICDEYAAEDSRFRVIHQKNGGVSRARNTGINNISADSSYIMFADPDDALRLDIVEKCVQKYKASSVDAVVFGVFLKFMNEKEEEVSHAEMYPSVEMKCENFSEVIHGPFRSIYGISGSETSNALFGDRSKYGRFLWCWAWCYRADLIRTYRIRFREDLKLREDGIFNCEYLMHCRSTDYIQDVGYDYFKRPDGAGAVLSHTRAGIENKILLVRYRGMIRDYISETENMDISEWCYGSAVLSAVQLCVSYSYSGGGGIPAGSNTWH